MNPPIDTREKIMDRAEELLLVHGFNGFSYRDISTHLGVKNAAVHYHFPSKADLGVALIERHRAQLRRRTAEFMAYGGSATEQVERMFAYTREHWSCGGKLCPSGALSVDYETLPAEVAEAARKLGRELLAWFTKVMAAGREQGELVFTGEPEQRALTVLSALQGGRQIARVHGVEALDAIIAQLRAELGIASATD